MDGNTSVNKPVRTRKPLPNPKVKSENSSGVPTENAQTFKSGGLNYQHEEFDKEAGKLKFHPQESNVTYADIGFSKENSPWAASNHDQTSKRRCLNYQEVEFDKKAGKLKFHPQESPVTYADISFTQSQKTDSRPVLTDDDADKETRKDDQTKHGLADNTVNSLTVNELPSREIPPRDVKPPRPGRKPAQMSKPFLTKNPLPKPSSLDG